MPFDEDVFDDGTFEIAGPITVVCAVSVAGRRPVSLTASPVVRCTLMAEDVVLGSTATLRAEFTDADGNAYAASSVRFSLRRPIDWIGGYEEIGTETGESLANPSTGVFTYQTELVYPGTYRYRFECLDSGNEAAAEASFSVRRPLA